LARLAAHPDVSLETILEGTVKLLPPGLLYPEIASARIELDGRTYATPNYREDLQQLSADIVAVGVRRGVLSVAYSQPMPDLDEGPFLKEERNLIDAVAGEVASVIERRQAELETERLQEQLRHSDRLATIGQLAAGVAHELNEPLGNILGFAQLAGKETGLTDGTVRDLKRIVAASLHAREVIRKLLVFARETAPSRGRVDVNELVEDGLYFLEARCRKGGIELIRDLSEGLPLMVADRSQLIQVLTNLVVNSIQAMPDGGQLTIGTSRESEEILLTVKDTGMGMSEEVLQQAFNPFYTTKDVDQGTGLGLSVVHGIITAHGGRISVTSRVDDGTTFVIRLPLEPATESEGVTGK
jgi:signal transduction histidine kinase